MRARVLFLALVGLLAAPCLGAPAEGGTLGQHLLTGHWQLRVDDQLDPEARIYMQRAPLQIVLISEALPAPLLIEPSKKSAVPIAEEAATIDPEDADALLVDASKTVGRSVSVVFSGQVTRITLGKKRLVIEDRDPLIGEFSVEQLRDSLPEFRRGLNLYEPGAGNMRLLERVEQDVEIHVFFGTWCPHCERLVPRLAKVLAQLETSKLTARYHLLPRRMSEDDTARQYGVGAVPTVILIADGKVLGRLEGRQLSRPETALTRVLFGGAGS